MPQKRKKTELLAPAGSPESLYAAVSAGADAVYAGADRFGARAYAENFSVRDLTEGMEYLHLFGRRLYLTLNILMKEREMQEIPEILDPLYRAGLDGVIVQDLGVIRYLRERYPGLPVHASTQMAVTGVSGTKFLKELGVSRVVLARELSLPEIREIQEETGMETEVFIHGAMCYSYSGLCLMSSMLGGRSGNRGRCAGPCRQPYGGREDRKKKGEGADSYLLSMKDLCGAEYVPALLEAGVSSLKIEGRMKPPAYVAGVTGIYREYIDACCEALEGRGLPDRAGSAVGMEGGDASAGSCPPMEKEKLRELMEIYTRGGLNNGYFGRHNGREMLTLSQGSYRSKLPEQGSRKLLSLPVEGAARIREGEPVRLLVRTGEYSAEAGGPIPEPARTRGLEEAGIRRQLMKTGGSGFSFSTLTIDTTGHAFLPLTALNELRREAFRRLKGEILRGYQRSL